MLNKDVKSILSEWTDEFNSILLNNNSLCIALFSTDGKLLFANNSMSVHFKGEPFQGFINPTFDELLLVDNSVSLIFNGFLTLGDYSSVNTSIFAQVYRKENKMLVVGGIDAAQLLEQNETMHQLNREISNLQRELIKEKNKIEKTLKQLNYANNELLELNASKDRFISILAHDLRNPLGSILGFLSLLTEDIRNYSIDEVESHIHIVNSAAQNTYNLLEEILTWARAQSGKTPFEPEKLCLADICENVFENLKLAANNKNITLHYMALDGVYIFADKEMITTVLRNLVSNAIKYTNKGGAINIYAEKDHIKVTITVSDNGTGIKPDTLTKLFDISYKISTNGTAKEKGSGLGLLLCKEFIKKHGGEIGVESKLGKGSAFKFTIPNHFD